MATILPLSTKAPLLESEIPLPRWRRGKVRDVYDARRDRLLVVATDRLSAFDVVLPTGSRGRASCSPSSRSSGSASSPTSSPITC